jgi:UDP-N-acetylglucosamine 2-epimerase
VLHVVGARPNFVKMAPVVEALGAAMPDVRQVVAHTGQHYDPGTSRVFFEELGMREPDYLLGVGSASHGAQTARALERLERVLEEEAPRAVVVAGDVNSTLAAALAAAKPEIRVSDGTNRLPGLDPAKIAAIHEPAAGRRRPAPPALRDGAASQRVATVLAGELGADARAGAPDAERRGAGDACR